MPGDFSLGFRLPLHSLAKDATEPDDIAQFGIRVGDQWKIGRAKVDDGVILIVAKDDRKLRLEVGYGLEGAIPDAIAKRVIAVLAEPVMLGLHEIATNPWVGIAIGPGDGLSAAALRKGAALNAVQLAELLVS